MAKVSVIIPVYNAERYLEDCANCIIHQSLTDFEVIIINDGSTDSTEAICKKICTKDHRFLYKSIENCGVSNARNHGIQLIKTPYVIFFDADDIIPENALDTLVSAFSNDIDMTMGGFTEFGEGRESYDVSIENTKVLNKEECLELMLPDGNKNWNKYIWNRMFRTSIIQKYNIKFDTNISYKEDGLFLVQYLVHCNNNVRYVNDIVYKYRRNPLSVMGRFSQVDTTKTSSSIIAHARIIKALRGGGVSLRLIDKTIEHAFGCRSWLLEVYHSENKLTKKIQLCTLLELYRAIGISRTMRHIWKHYHIK